MTVVHNHERRTSRAAADSHPDPKRLSQRELRDIVHRLDLRQQALQAAIAEERHRIDTEALSQLDAEVGDQVDQAFVMTSVEMERGLIDRYRQELEQIAAVRERLAGGVFGVCVDCGEPIGAARLQAQPTAVRCTDCQWRHEKIVDIATGSTIP